MDDRVKQAGQVAEAGLVGVWNRNWRHLVAIGVAAVAGLVLGVWLRWAPGAAAVAGALGATIAEPLVRRMGGSG